MVLLFTDVFHFISSPGLHSSVFITFNHLAVCRQNQSGRQSSCAKHADWDLSDESNDTLNNKINLWNKWHQSQLKGVQAINHCKYTYRQAQQRSSKKLWAPFENGNKSSTQWCSTLKSSFNCNPSSGEPTLFVNNRPTQMIKLKLKCFIKIVLIKSSTN